MGRQAASLLIDSAMTRKSPYTRLIKVDCPVVVRHSVARAPGHGGMGPGLR
jgi:DNA-binding LacI/PurR family transcriptional regulator